MLSLDENAPNRSFVRSPLPKGRHSHHQTDGLEAEMKTPNESGRETDASCLVVEIVARDHPHLLFSSHLFGEY